MRTGHHSQLFIVITSLKETAIAYTQFTTRSAQSFEHLRHLHSDDDYSTCSILFCTKSSNTITHTQNSFFFPLFLSLSFLSPSAACSACLPACLSSIQPPIRTAIGGRARRARSPGNSPELGLPGAQRASERVWGCRHAWLLYVTQHSSH